MKAKGIIVLCVLFILAFGALSVQATQCENNFTLTAGAASTVTDASTKFTSNSNSLYFFPQRQTYYLESEWNKGVTVNFRGRTQAYNNATYLKAVTQAGDYTTAYYSNSGYIGNNYRLATNLPSNTTQQTVYLTVYWTP